jgi:lysophospholipase
LPDRLKGHAAGFKDFLGDYRALLAAFETRLPKPWIALGHSMGGCLTMLALATGERRFAAAVLSAPMLGLNTGGKPAGAARALAWLMSRSRYKGEYVLGDVGDPFVQSFPGDALTHDAARYARHRAQIRANPDIALGGITWGWTDFAFSACAFLRRTKGVEAVSIPVTIVAAGQDSRVLIADEKSIAGRIPQGRYVEIADAFHEILIETDDRRGPVLEGVRRNRRRRRRAIGGPMTVWRPRQEIRPVAIGLLRDGDRLLVAEVPNDDGSVKGWRPLGGGIPPRRP